MMSVFEFAQFHFPHLKNDLNESSNTPLIYCPVCGKKQEVTEIETHTARCADAFLTVKVKQAMFQNLQLKLYSTRHSPS